jgi:hypothetical protein
VGGVSVLFGLAVFLERRYSFLQKYNNSLRFWGSGKGRGAPTVPVEPTGYRNPDRPATSIEI